MKRSHHNWSHTGVLALVTLLGLLIVTVATTLSGCGSDSPDATAGTETARPQAVAATGYLADIVKNVAGDRFEVVSLMPEQSDSHSFEPTPQDVKLLAESRVVIVDHIGLSPPVDDLIAGSAQEGRILVEAAEGLVPRADDETDEQEGEEHEGEGDAHEEEGAANEENDDGHGHGGADLHFWLDPVNVITYVENICAGLAAADPEGVEIYQANADAYVSQLEELDSWIAGQVAEIPAERRLLVTNHEELGYFADRYGFEIVGAVFPSVAGEGTPSARQLAALVEEIREKGAPAIFLEAGSNPAVAEELARETGVKVVDDLYTHSLGPEAETYLDMMRWDVERIVEALR